jgi:WD40 repeat protein
MFSKVRLKSNNREYAGEPVAKRTILTESQESRDGKWVVSGTTGGLVTVWNAESHSKLAEFDGHEVQSTSHQTQRKLQPDRGTRLPASGHSVRVYDSQSGHHRRLEFPIQVNSFLNQSLAWASDNKQLFVLSRDGNIHCLGVSTGTTLSQWPIHSNQDARCIALASNGAFTAASAGSLMSFWDTSTREQIGSVIEYTHDIWSMAITPTYDLVIGGERTITLQGLCDTLPSYYSDDVSVLTSKFRSTSWLPNSNALFACDRCSVSWKSQVRSFVHRLVSLTSTSIRHQNCAPREDSPRTPHTARRIPTKSRSGEG